ncbi:MAG TPA: ABC transporter permease [Acidimicrobiia bacterium]|nr:ABC transporter permease [Acidimicrobiia bacterium]
MTQTTQGPRGPAEMSDAEELWYSGKWIDRVPQWVSITVLGLAMLGLWWLIAELMPQNLKILLAGPADTFEELWDTTKNIVSGGHIAEGLWITTQEVLLGFLAAAILGFVLGVVVGETRLGKRAVMPYLVALNALPKVAFAPVFVAWFGFGVNSKIVMALFIAFFPVIVDTAAGLYSVDADTVMLFQSMEASRWQTLRKLKLPSALPFIFAGLKTAAVFSVVGAVVGEYLGGGHGLGELIRLSAQTLRIDRVFALIVYLGILGLILFGVVAWAEKKLLFWHKSEIFEIQGTG